MKTITLNEKSYNKLKKRLVNEISYGTVDRAYDRSDDIFWEARSAFEDFYSALDDAIYKVKYESGNGE
jgi:predicted nucleic acid-binding protein